MKLAFLAISGRRPIPWRKWAGGSIRWRHLGQTLRTRRWAMTAMTELATRNGWTPISTSLVTALGASFVWSVLKTKCPVSEAWIAVFAVSSSRISPTRRMFGILPQHGTDDACERHPDLGLHLALVDAGQVVLDRVLGGDDLDVGPVQLVERGVEGGRLARPGRAGHEQDAVGPLDQLLEPLPVLVAEAEVA